MKNFIKKLYIVLGDSKYQIRFLTTGKTYVTRELTRKGFEKFMRGEVTLKAGIIK